MIPDVSVIMTVYNGEKYLAEAIESVLNQSFIEFEFIIVNDCSTDASLSIIESYQDNRIIIINNEVNLGLSKSCNLAIRYARGSVIVRMDSDDICFANRLQVQYQYLTDHPEIILLGTNADIIDMNGAFIYTTDLPQNDLEIKESLNFRSTFIHPTVAFRKSFFDKAGGYYEPIKHYFEDFILWNQFAKLGKFKILPQSLLQYRIVMNSISTKATTKGYKSLERIIAKRGYAEEQELAYIIKEKANQGTIKNAEEAYYLILAKNLLFKNYNPVLARKKLAILFKKNRLSIKGIIYLSLSFLPKKFLDSLYQSFKKQ